MRRVCLVILMGLATAAHGQLAKERVGSNQLLIAGAGATSGANGTFFRSDITVLNYRTDADQRVFLNWVPQGVSGVGRAPVDIVIPKASGISSEDFVTSIMNQTGLGSILITAVTADGQLDLAGKLHATARIWSNQPGVSNGTVSQTFPIIALSEVNSPRLTIVGQRRDDRFRTNVGIINLDPANEQVFRISVLADSRTELVNVTVPPMSMNQVGVIGPPAQVFQIAVTNVSPTIRSTNWIAYGSSVDNVTGDSWSSLGYVAPPDQP